MERQYDEQNSGSPSFCRHALEYPDFAQSTRVRLSVDCQMVGQVPGLLKAVGVDSIGHWARRFGAAVGDLHLPLAYN
jgi:hypothetical protein